MIKLLLHGAETLLAGLLGRLSLLPFRCTLLDTTQEKEKEEFRSVLSTLPYPGHLLRIENIIDINGSACRAYVWQHQDPQLGDRISLFAVQDGRYLEDSIE